MDIYKIGILLSMSSNHANVLSALSSQLLHVHTNVNTVTGGFTRLKGAIAGALSVTAGVTILATMEKLIEKTKGYSDELVKLERLGGPMAAAVNSGDIDEGGGNRGREIRRIAHHRETFTFSLRLCCLREFEPFRGNLQPYRLVQRTSHLHSYACGFLGSLPAISGVVGHAG